MIREGETKACYSVKKAIREEAFSADCSIDSENVGKTAFSNRKRSRIEDEVSGRQRKGN